MVDMMVHATWVYTQSLLAIAIRLHVMACKGKMRAKEGEANKKNFFIWETEIVMEALVSLKLPNFVQI
jgi:hypothetical protein